MKHMETFTQEPYEAPAISEIAPVTVTQVVGTTTGPDPDEQNPDDY